MNDVTLWTVILVGSACSYLLKLAGLVVPAAWLERPVVEWLLDLMPAALLAALVVVQAFSAGPALVLDSRAAGVVAAVLALLLRAPFPLVLAVAGAAAAGTYLLV